MEQQPGELSLNLERPAWSPAQWWRSDWGPGPLIRLALPLMISAGFVSLTLFIDRMLLYWHSEVEASAAMGAGVIYWSLICLPVGTLGYVSTFVAQYRGAQHPKRIGIAYRHALWLAWSIVPLLLAAIACAPWLFTWSGHGVELAELESDYLRILLVGGISVLFYSVQSGLLTGQGRTGVVLLLDGISTAVNLLLDAVLISGAGPIPELGIVGAGIATSFSFWLKMPLAYWIIGRNRRAVEAFGVRQAVAWEPAMMRRLIVYGAPAGLQMLAEAGCFANPCSDPA